VRCGAFVLLIALALHCLSAPPKDTPKDAIEQSDLIAIGDLTSGQKIRLGDDLDCRAQVRLTRILKNAAGGALQQIAVHWQYAPRREELDEPSPTVAPIHAIWFLKRQESGDTYEAMWVELSQKAMGGYLLPIPERESGPCPRYAPDAHYETKLAAELACAMQTIAASAGDRLNVENRIAGSSEKNRAFFAVPGGSRVGGPNITAPGPGPKPEPAIDQFRSLAFLYRELDPAQIRSANQYLLARPEIHLKDVGLFGELRAKDADAIVLLEKLHQQLDVTINAREFAFTASMIDIRGNDSAIQATGNLAVSEDRIINFGDWGVGQLAATKSRTAVPYLETILLHPDARVRQTAADGICAVFSAESDFRELADEQLISACRFTTVVANRIGNHAQPGFRPPEADVESLRAWLAAHTAEMRSATGADPPPAPSWFTETAVR